MDCNSYKCFEKKRNIYEIFYIIYINLYITEIRELFRLFDTSNDRSISATELGKAMRFLGMSPTQQEIEDAMRALDTNCKY